MPTKIDKTQLYKDLDWLMDEQDDIWNSVCRYVDALMAKKNIADTEKELYDDLLLWVPPEEARAMTQQVRAVLKNILDKKPPSLTH